MEESLPDLKSLLGFDPDEDEETPEEKRKAPPVSHEEEEFDLTAFLEDDEDDFYQPTVPSSTAAPSPEKPEEEEEIVFDWDEEDETPSSRVSSFGTDLPADFDDEDEEDWKFGVDAEEEDEEDEEDDDYEANGNALYYPDPSPRAFEDDEAEEEPEVEETPAPASKKKKVKGDPTSEGDEEKGGFAQKFKEKFADFKAQAAAELHGDDAPKAKAPGKELAVIDPDDKQEDNSDGKEVDEDKGEGRKKSSRKNPLKAIFAPFWKLYLSLVDIIFNTLNGVLGFLAKIPILGIPFKFLKQFTKPLKIIATSLPLLLVLGVLVYLNMNAVPQETKTALPDNGSVVFTEFEYDASKKLASGTLKNTGEVIAEGKPVFTVYSLKPGLNPLSWFMPQERLTCEGAFVRVDIDKVKRVQATCKGDIPGFQIKTSGELK